MSKFKVGDIIKANKESNGVYCYTNQERNWTGKVLSIENGLIYAETITPTAIEEKRTSFWKNISTLWKINKI